MIPEATTNMKENWGFGWMLAFIGFPPGGALAMLLVGRVETPLEAVIGGAAAGLVIGGAQMLALRRRLPVRLEWIAASATGSALGFSASIALFGTETTLEAILMRAPLTGLFIGAAQWLALRKHLRNAFWLIPANPVIYTLAWFITAQVIGASVNEGFVVFGASGALVYQALTGLLLWTLLSAERRNQIL